MPDHRGAARVAPSAGGQGRPLGSPHGGRMRSRVAFLGPREPARGRRPASSPQEWGVPQIATGDMLREAVAAGTPLGREAKRYMDQGALVPDEVVVGVMRSACAQADTARGFILDGFPRTIGQAEALTRILGELGEELEAVVYFDVAEAELLRRLTGRRVCRQCGASFPPGLGSSRPGRRVRPLRR